MENDEYWHHFLQSSYHVLPSLSHPWSAVFAVSLSNSDGIGPLTSEPGSLPLDPESTEDSRDEPQCSHDQDGLEGSMVGLPTVTTSSPNLGHLES